MAASVPKHLKPGSECPSLKENQLRLYGMRFCPFVQRTKLVMAAKGIPFEEIYINLADPPEWYLKKNPTGQVPSLEWIDANSKQTALVPESLIICDYLDEKYPEHRLHPLDPYLKAKQRVLVDRMGNGQDVANAIKDLNEHLGLFEQALENTFFGGSTPAMIDYMIWPWFERFPFLREAGYVFNADGKFPKLAAWIKAMEASNAVKQVKVPEAAMKKFMDSFRSGKTEYDV
ncbi:unnamed protein product [Rotaria sp. Silwood1]|nr:unnamed protein product [Rotaria sp. Silwood1]CAF3902708.1 unnamed protein product [Rotaria sp. Silwood1]CAF4880636.1 unnamed protein product [Rotaria sp. Silwood1]CAF4883576.1 unnamed protein product [Rotaria sp. Silwood1]CAF5075631.1 unnamed protein product [Rotaria sp. Silwood1]